MTFLPRFLPLLAGFGLRDMAMFAAGGALVWVLWSVAAPFHDAGVERRALAACEARVRRVADAASAAERVRQLEAGRDAAARAAARERQLQTKIEETDDRLETAIAERRTAVDAARAAACRLDRADLEWLRRAEGAGPRRD